MITNILFFIVLPAIILTISLLSLKFYGYRLDGWSEFFTLAGMILSGMALMVFTLLIILNPITVNSNYRKYSSFVETIKNSRNQGVNPVENAALTFEIARWNGEVMDYKYYREHFPLFYPAIIDKMEIIK